MNDKLLSFMNDFIDKGDEKIDEELFELERVYSDKFGHGVPREMFPPSITDVQIKEAVLKCVETGKDELFEILSVTIDESKLY